MPDMLKPSLTLLVKLGSIAVHTQELLSPDGHQFDRIALDALFNDPEVRDWIKEMDAAAMLPRKGKHDYRNRPCMGNLVDYGTC